MAKNAAAIVGLSEWVNQRPWDRPMFTLEAMAQLASEALADAGIEKDEVDGLLVSSIRESPMFAPSAAAEYLGIRSNFNEIVDLGGATAAGMVWRAAVAIEAGMCETALVLLPSIPAPRPDGDGPRALSGSFGNLGGGAWGSPWGQFDSAYGLEAPNLNFALIASRYQAQYGVAPETLAKIAVHERHNAQANPKAIFRDTPITIDDVLNSRLVADPLHLLEIVMPCFGGGALVITSMPRARRLPHRPVVITGFGEHLTHKSVTYARDLIDTPIRVAADRAFAMAGVEREAIDLASVSSSTAKTLRVSLICAK